MDTIGKPPLTRNMNTADEDRTRTKENEVLIQFNIHKFHNLKWGSQLEWNRLKFILPD